MNRITLYPVGKTSGTTRFALSLPIDEDSDGNDVNKPFIAVIDWTRGDLDEPDNARIVELYDNDGALMIGRGSDEAMMNAYDQAFPDHGYEGWDNHPLYVGAGRFEQHEMPKMDSQYIAYKDAVELLVRNYREVAGSCGGKVFDDDPLSLGLRTLIDETILRWNDEVVAEGLTHISDYTPERFAYKYNAYLDCGADDIHHYVSRRVTDLRAQPHV